MKQKKGAFALLPILVFLVIYIGTGVYYEYLHPQEGVQGFYVMSVVVAFMAAIAVALFQNRTVSFDEKMKICASGMGDDNILTMIFIFLLAGAAASPPLPDVRRIPRTCSLVSSPAD